MGSLVVLFSHRVITNPKSSKSFASIVLTSQHHCPKQHLGELISVFSFSQGCKELNANDPAQFPSALCRWGNYFIKKPEMKGAGFESEGKVMLVFAQCTHNLCVTSEFRPKAILGLRHPASNQTLMLPESKTHTTYSLICLIISFTLHLCHWSSCVSLTDHECVRYTKILQVVLFFNDIVDILRGKSLNFEGKLQV